MPYPRAARMLSQAMVLIAAVSAAGLAQQRKLRVISSDSTPIVYAYVAAEGGLGQITDENGEISLGAGKSKTLTLDVRRIGFQPWFGKIVLPDTAAVLTVMLARVAQSLEEVRVNGRGDAPVALQGFYDRWLMRQKGTLSATFIGPEEIEKRHPERASDLLNGVLGVSLMRTDKGSVIAKSGSGTCYMTIMLDGKTLCPTTGCHVYDGNGISLGGGMPVPGHASLEDVTVDINKYVGPNDVAAIEVYARGGNMPISLQAADNSCGVIAIWTGPRR